MSTDCRNYCRWWTDMQKQNIADSFRKPLNHLNTAQTRTLVSLHISTPILEQWFETFFVIRRVLGMVLNNYAGDSAQKWPQIFISTSRKRFCGPSAPSVTYPAVQRALAVQLEALQRTSLSVGHQAGQDQDQLPQTHLRNPGCRSSWQWPAGRRMGRDLNAAGGWLIMLCRWRSLKVCFPDAKQHYPKKYIFLIIIQLLQYGEYTDPNAKIPIETQRALQLTIHVIK